MSRKALIVYGGWEGHEPDKVAGLRLLIVGEGRRFKSCHRYQILSKKSVNYARIDDEILGHVAGGSFHWAVR